MASTAKDGQLIVWCISEGDDGMLTGKQTLALQLPAPVGGVAPVRLAWHPSCQNLIFFTTGSRVLAAHISELTATAQQVWFIKAWITMCMVASHSNLFARYDCIWPQVDIDDKALPPGLVCLPPGNGDAQLTSVAVSSDGELLAAGSSDGMVSH